MTSTHKRTPESEELLALAKRLAAAYQPITNPDAVLLVGSAAEGISDEYSDLDLSLYYEENLPSDEQLDVARAEANVVNPFLLAPRSERGVLESFTVDGVECQLAHVPIASFTNDVESVLVKFDAGSVMQKVLEGLVNGIPIHGHDFLSHWQDRARGYPDGLKTAMVRHYLQIRPIWYVSDRLSGRDATIFLQQMRIDAALSILGILAGLNGVYFSTSQFKRMGKFVERLSVAPRDLADRLEWAFEADPDDGARMIEDLASETLALVRVHAPEVNLDDIRIPPGQRQSPWRT